MNARFVALLVLGIALGACSGSPDEPVVQDPEALHKGGGDGPPVWGDDPCKNPNATIGDPNKDHVYIGTSGDDVIVGTDDRDVIYGNGGHDIICARGGIDEIHGGDGNDYIDGGAGNDAIEAGPGDDVVHGRAGGDDIHGGDGDDLLFGDILDDEIWGDEGSDLLIGGHGTDRLHGGGGADWMRGDTGNDSFFGGDGEDVVSFMTAMPPVEQEPGHEYADDGIEGVIVNFNDACIDDDDPKRTPHQGCAYGDGKGEPLDDVEIIVGSPFSDHFISANENKQFVGGFGDDKFDVPSKKDVIDGQGNDTFNGHPFGGPGITPMPGRTFVMVDKHERDLGVVIMGTTSRDAITIHPSSGKLQIDAVGNTKLDAGPGCHQHGDGMVDCDIDHTLRWVAAYGDDGNDDILFQGNLPRDFTAHANGGKGGDKITGGDEEDVFFTGVEGEDWLWGNEGDDALLSESEPSINKLKLKQQVSYTDGADHLFAGPGDDQLVADFPCGGHEYSGGTGIDVAGFARSGHLPLGAQLAQMNDGPSIMSPYYAHARNIQRQGYTGAWCDASKATTLHPDLEILEGSSAEDELYGNDENNVIWGRQGNDVIHGLKGDDVLDGLGDDDQIWGEDGNDILEGGAGFDHLHASDGQRDILLCQEDGGKVEDMDSKDEFTGCKYR